MIVATLSADDGTAVAILDDEAETHRRWAVPADLADADELDAATVAYLNAAFDPDDPDDMEGRHRPFGVAAAERAGEGTGLRLTLAPITYTPADGRVA